MTNYELLSLVVALVALFQPWGMAAWRKWIRKGTLDIYPAGRLEIGYSPFGLVVSLHGTLRASHQDLFVTRMTTTVTKLSDAATKTLDWIVFLPDRVGGASENSSLELAHPFVVTQSQPGHYHVAFRSLELERGIQSLLLPVQQEWERQPINEERLRTLETQGNLDPGFGNIAEEAFRQFSQSATFSQTYVELERRCFWEQGSYRLSLNIYTAQRTQPFMAEWVFEINSEEIRRLRLNAITMLHIACGYGVGWRYNIIYPDYKPAGKLEGD